MVLAKIEKVDFEKLPWHGAILVIFIAIFVITLDSAFS